MVLFSGMKDNLVSIDKAGRIVLPKSVREELAINPGDLLKVSTQGNQVTLRPEREKAGFIKRGSALIFSTGGADVLENDIVEEIRNSEHGSSNLNVAEGLLKKRK
jgi:AbrB family looped-hinge helix DNA binding protein